MSKPRSSRVATWFPVVVVALGLWSVVSALRPDPEGDWALSEFANLPVVDQGRVKPMDTLARTSLLVLSKKQTIRTNGERGTPVSTQCDDNAVVFHQRCVS